MQSHVNMAFAFKVFYADGLRNLATYGVDSRPDLNIVYVSGWGSCATLVKMKCKGKYRGLHCGSAQGRWRRGASANTKTNTGARANTGVLHCVSG